MSTNTIPLNVAIEAAEVLRAINQLPHGLSMSPLLQQRLGHVSGAFGFYVEQINRAHVAEVTA